MFVDILKNPANVSTAAAFTHESLVHDYPVVNEFHNSSTSSSLGHGSQPVIIKPDDIYAHEEVEESLNIMDKEKELIVKALKKHKGKRKDASMDLGISERTLYRKLKEYDIDE